MIIEQYSSGFIIQFVFILRSVYYHVRVFLFYQVYINYQLKDNRHYVQTIETSMFPVMICAIRPRVSDVCVEYASYVVSGVGCPPVTGSKI